MRKAAHLEEVAELLTPSVLQTVITLQPFKHVLHAPSNSAYRWIRHKHTMHKGMYRLACMRCTLSDLSFNQQFCNLCDWPAVSPRAVIQMCCNKPQACAVCVMKDMRGCGRRGPDQEETSAVNRDVSSKMIFMRIAPHHQQHLLSDT